MKPWFQKSTVFLLLLCTLLSGYTYTRPIFSKNNPHRIQSKLIEKDLKKRNKVYLLNGKVKSGVLGSYTPQELELLYPESKTKETIEFDRIEKVEIRSANYALIPILPFGVVGFIYISRGISKSLGKAFNQMGH